MLSISTFYPSPATAVSVVKITGMIQQFSIGGEKLYIHELCIIDGGIDFPGGGGGGGPDPCPGDATGDFIVNIFDLLFTLVEFGNDCN